MAGFRAFLSGLGAFLSALGRWWQDDQRRKALAAAQEDADRINAHPADEWMRRFKEQRNDSATASAVGKSRDDT